MRLGINFWLSRIEYPSTSRPKALGLNWVVGEIPWAIKKTTKRGTMAKAHKPGKPKPTSHDNCRRKRIHRPNQPANNARSSNNYGEETGTSIQAAASSDKCKKQASSPSLYIQKDEKELITMVTALIGVICGSLQCVLVYSSC